MGFPLFFLSAGSIFFGFFFKDAFIGIGSVFWGNSIFILADNQSGFDLEFTPFFLKNLPLFFSIIGILLALWLNSFFVETSMGDQFCSELISQTGYRNSRIKSLIKIIWFLNNKWYFDCVYNNYVVYFILRHCYETFYKLFDKGVIEICGPSGLSFTLYQIASGLSKKQSGYVYQSTCLLVLSLLFLFCFFIIW
jgi:NADH-ubiquinone oxidoreductase chain 5